MHVTTRIDFFRERLNAESEIKFTVGGNEFQTLITRSEKSFYVYCWSNNFYTICVCGLVYLLPVQVSGTTKCARQEVENAQQTALT